MSISNEDVFHIARLARLRIGPEQAEQYASSLSEILDLVGQMNTIDTAAIAPMAHPQDVSLRLRADEVTEENQRDEFQKIAPQTEAGLYLVPKVIE